MAEPVAKRRNSRRAYTWNGRSEGRRPLNIPKCDAHSRGKGDRLPATAALDSFQRRPQVRNERRPDNDNDPPVRGRSTSCSFCRLMPRSSRPVIARRLNTPAGIEVAGSTLAVELCFSSREREGKSLGTYTVCAATPTRGTVSALRHRGPRRGKRGRGEQNKKADRQ